MENRLDEVIKKALELFGQYGIKSVSMNDIADSLAMSKKTLYCLVKDKNNLITSVMDYMSIKYKESMQVFHDINYNAIEQFFVMGKNMNVVYGNIQPVFLYDLRKYNPIISKVAIEEKNSILESAFLSNIEQGKNEKLYHDDIDNIIVSKILLLYHIHFLSPTSDMFTDIEQFEKRVHREVFKYHFRAICTQKGTEELKRQISLMDICKINNNNK